VRAPVESSDPQRGFAEGSDRRAATACRLYIRTTALFWHLARIGCSTVDRGTTAWPEDFASGYLIVPGAAAVDEAVRSVGTQRCLIRLISIR
jgi:hypothetical protein